MKRQSNLFRLLFLLLAMFCITSIQAQEVAVTGTVTDAEDGMPLPGVTVAVKGTTTGTITTPDGVYTLNVDKGQTLVFSFIGYKPFEAIVGDQSQINVALEADVIGMDEVVVIGYGTVKKEDATGSVAVIGADDFNQGAITSPQELIVGKTPGVVVTTNSGAPGTGATIRIRGGSSLQATNDPLIVIDGFPVDNVEIRGVSNPLSLVNPNDIESMSILKDASATAIYGSRASNGVIIITTKKGTRDGLNISYNGNVSVGTPVKTIDVLNGDEFRSVVQDRVDNHGLNAAALDRIGSENTDWQDEIYQTSVSTDHNVSLHGLYQGVPYRASIGHTVENGILKESGLNRTTLALKVNPSFLDDNLKVGIDLKGMNIHNNFSNTDAIGRAFEFDPTQPVRDGNDDFGGYFAWRELSDPTQPINIATHNAVASLKYRDNTADVKRGIANLQFDYQMPFLPGMRANLSMGYDHSESEGVNNTDSRASWSYREPAFNLQDYSQIKKNSLLDFYLNYVKELGDNKFDFTAGYGWQHFYRERNDKNKAYDDVEWDRDITRKNENYLVSFFGRLNYTFKDRYLVTATLRNDGSSRFSEDNRWGLFPAVSFAWKINEEAFLSGFEPMTDLKLRVGYGVTGQQDINDNYYPYVPIYSESTEGAYYQFGDGFISTLRPDPYDPNIKWEETTTYNVGLDFGFFNNRLTGSIDAYHRETVDLISQIPIAAGTNFSNFLTTNVGSLENTGFEVGLNWRAISTAEMSWEIGANVSRNVNEITSLSKVQSDDDPGYALGGIAGGVGNNVMWNTVGQSASTFYLFKQIYDTDGMPIEGLYVDKTGLGGNVAANEDNKYLMETATPDYLIGITSKFNYKNFDFSFAGRLSLGNYVYNNNNSNRALYQNLYNQAGYLANIPTAIKETQFSTAQYWSDIYLEDASFFRMDNITFGYSFSKLFTEKLSGRVSATVQNAFVITDYSGLDPEVDGGIDNNIYPRPRTYMLGVNINF